MPEIPRVGPDVSVDEVITGLDGAGIVVVEGHVDTEGVDAVVADLDPWLDRAFAPLASSYQLNIAHLLVRDPGTEMQLIHRDEEVWVHLQQLMLGVEPHPEVQLACVTSLVDFTADVGATVVVPGSHRWERGRQPEPADLVPAEMPAGSTAIYRGSLLHGGGANSTKRPRAAVHRSYVAGWLRTEESGLLATAPAAARRPPEPHRPSRRGSSRGRPALVPNWRSSHAPPSAGPRSAAPRTSCSGSVTRIGARAVRSRGAWMIETDHGGGVHVDALAGPCSSGSDPAGGPASRRQAPARIPVGQPALSRPDRAEVHT